MIVQMPSAPPARNASATASLDLLLARALDGGGEACRCRLLGKRLGEPQARRRFGRDVGAWAERPGRDEAPVCRNGQGQFPVGM